MSKQTVEVSKKFKVKQPNGTFKQVYIATDANKVSVTSDKNLNTYLAEMVDDMADITNRISTENTNAALERKRNKIRQHNVVFPIYIGHDYVPVKYQPSSFVANGGIIYILNGESGSQNGLVTRYNVTDNVILQPLSTPMPMAHANSAALDKDNNIYVIRTKDNNSDEGEAAKKLYKYSLNNFTSGTPTVEEISFGGNGQPQTILAVSYDWKTKILYFLDYSYQVWTRTNNTWEKYSIIQDEWDKEHSGWVERGEYNQDFAVYDSCFYISSPKRMVLSGVLEPGTSYITDSFILASETSDHLYYLGENEGWEFTPDGHLMMVDYIGVSYQSRCVFYLEVPTAHSMATIPRSDRVDPSTETHVGTLWDGILNHSNRYRVNISSNIQKQFAVNGKQVKSLNDILIRKMGKPTIVTIKAYTDGTTDTVTEPYDVIIKDPLTLEFQNYTKIVLNAKVRVRADFHITTSAHHQLQIDYLEYKNNPSSGGQIFQLEGGNFTVDSMGGDFPQDGVDPQYPLYVKGPNISNANAKYSLVFTSFGEPFFSIDKEPYFWDYTSSSYKLLSTFSNRSLIRGYDSNLVPSFGYPCVIRRGKQFLSTSTLNSLTKTGILGEIEDCTINQQTLTKDGLGNIELYCNITLSNNMSVWSVIATLPNGFHPAKVMRVVGTLQYVDSTTGQAAYKTIPMAVNPSGSNQGGIQIGTAAASGNKIHLHVFYR